MEPSDLALFTTQELIDELTRRTTFLGVVVHSGSDYKNLDWEREKVFKVRFNSNLSKKEACRLLGAVARQLNSRRQDSE